MFDRSADIVYYSGPDQNNDKHRLDIYSPQGLNNRPVYFFVHGGTWQEGNKEFYSYVGQRFARAGYVSVVINYRLTPEVIHPGHIEDVARAFAWIYHNIAEFRGDPERIFISGHSAGGHLVSLLSLNEKYLEAENLSSDTIQGVISISGVYDIASYPDDVLSEVFTTDQDLRLDASPIAHVDENQPRFLIIYAEFDLITLDEQAKDLAVILEEKGTLSEIIKISNKTHATIVLHLANESDDTSNAILKYMHENLD